LQWLTLVITCGLVSALVLGFFGTIFHLIFVGNHVTLTYVLQTLGIGGLMGIFTVTLVDAPKSLAKPGIVSWKGIATGLAFGLIIFFTDWVALRDNVPTALTIGMTCALLASLWPYLTWTPSSSRPAVFAGKRFVVGLLLGLLGWSAFFDLLVRKDPLSSVLVSLPLAFVCGGLSALWRFIHWEASNPEPGLFSRKGFLVGLVIGFLPWLMYFMAQIATGAAKFSGPRLLESLLVLVVVVTAGAFALANAAAGSISQYILWKANLLPLRRLGAIGLVLLLLGTSLQGVPAVLDLINFFGTP
jgi:hypothetical protein